MKAKISNFLRKINLLYAADKLRFVAARWKNRKKNAMFQAKHSEFKFPPDYLIYESFKIDYESYFNSGKTAADWLTGEVIKYTHADSIKILDWGCGPARVVRHMNDSVKIDKKIFATDYNPKTIEWNKKNIQNVDFNLNGIKAELPYENDFFDFIYGISIFTHLSGKLHIDWKQELTRILKKNGVLLITVQGNLFKTILTESEIKEFDNGNLVVRGKVKEGHRTYSAFQPDSFMEQLFSDYDILAHIPSRMNNGYLEQDVWVLRKK